MDRERIGSNSSPDPYEDSYSPTAFGQETYEPKSAQPESQPKGEWRDGFLEWLNEQKQKEQMKKDLDKKNDEDYYNKRREGMEQERARKQSQEAGKKAVEAKSRADEIARIEEIEGMSPDKELWDDINENFEAQYANDRRFSGEGANPSEGNESEESQASKRGESGSNALIEQELTRIDERLKALDETIKKIEEEIAEIKRKLEQSPAPAGATPSGAGEAAVYEINDIVSDETPIETPDEVVGEAENSHENEARNVANKARKSSRFARFFEKHKKKIVAGLAALIAAGALFASGLGFDMNKFDKASKEDMNSGRTNIQQEQVIDTSEISQESEYGIKDGYTQPGLWASEHKTGPYAFADAGEVAEVTKVNGEVDECEMIKYVADNQVESFADYLANLPEALQPEGFKGLSILETETKLESLSPDEYEIVQKQFNDAIEQGMTRRMVIDGEFNNAYMKKIDANGALNHDNMDLIACTTHEKNLEVLQLYWTNDQGDEIGSMLIKMTPVYDSDGSVVSYEKCMQVLKEASSTEAYRGMTFVPADPIHPDQPYIPPTTPEAQPSDNPDVQPTDNPDVEPSDNPDVRPTEEIQPKDRENMQRIDEQINRDIANDVGTAEVRVTPTEEVSQSDITTQPTGNDYEGTGPTIVENPEASSATPVQETVSDDNIYSANTLQFNPIQPLKPQQIETKFL